MLRIVIPRLQDDPVHPLTHSHSSGATHVPLFLHFGSQTAKNK